MAVVKLSTLGKRMLRKASSDAIAKYFQSMSPANRRKKWLPKNNRYRLACTQKYLSDINTSPSSVDHDAMIAYIAASAPGHAIDGWSFLGRSIDSLLRNDVYSAIHFGYYAELRAAMALLAAEGVGILDANHPVIDRLGNTSTLPKANFWSSKKNNGAGGWDAKPAGTHKIVWPCVRHWSSLPKSFELIDEVFRPADIGLQDWLGRLGSQVSAKAVSKQWVTIWGVDLSLLDDDHHSRNLVSYRPSSLRQPEVPSVVEILEYVSGLWKCFEPSTYGRFQLLERHLVRRALRLGQIVFPLAQGALKPIGIHGAEEAAWLRVLNSNYEPRLFADADLSSPLEQNGCHFQVLSRAALLLNLATAAVRRHLRRASYTVGDLQYWWHTQGVERGLWNQSPVSNPLDSWADINELLGDTDAWLVANGNGGSLAQWRKNQSSSLNLLSAFELVGMWGLLP
jgi:hypothetical protein